MTEINQHTPAVIGRHVAEAEPAVVMTSSKTFMQAEARILASMHLGEISIEDGQKIIGELESKEQRKKYISSVTAARDIGLPDCNELAKAPIASLNARLDTAFNRQIEFISKFREGIPPLKLHGTSPAGLSELSTHGPREGKLWFAQLSYQCEEPRIFAYDLLNISKKAASYSFGEQGMAHSDGGVLILSGPPPQQGFEKFRSWLNDDYSLATRYATGAFAERVYQDVNPDDFKRDMIGSVAWKNTPFSFAEFISNIDLGEQGSYLRREVFDNARAIYLMHAILKMIEPETGKFGIHKPVPSFEEQRNGLITKSDIGNEVHYTYPDGYTLVKSPKGIRKAD